MPYKDPAAQKAAQRRAYQKNKEMYLQRNRNRRLLHVSIAKAIKEEGCMDCGGSFPPYMMDFDHRDPSTKFADPSRYNSFATPLKYVDELAKCDPVCANCHRRREHNRRMGT